MGGGARGILSFVALAEIYGRLCSESTALRFGQQCLHVFCMCVCTYLAIRASVVYTSISAHIVATEPSGILCTSVHMTPAASPPCTISSIVLLAKVRGGMSGTLGQFLSSVIPQKQQRSSWRQVTNQVFSVQSHPPTSSMMAARFFTFH
jgi:hypothetical protein